MDVIFQTSTSLNGDKYLWVEHKYIDEYVQHFNETNKYYGVVVSAFKGYKSEDISFVKQLTNLRGLSLNNDKTDTSVINELASLQDLSIAKVHTPLDFSLLPLLQVYRGEWSKKLVNLGKSTSLRELCLRGFKPKTADLTDLGALSQLKSLELVQGNISTLAGIEQMAELEFLELCYQRYLTDLSALRNGPVSLNKIRFESCKKITSYAAIAGCKNLTALSIDKSAAIDDVSFIHELKQLKDFLFINTAMDKSLYGQLHTPSLLRVVNTRADCIFDYLTKPAGDGVSEARGDGENSAFNQVCIESRTAVALTAIKAVYGTTEDKYGATAFVQHHLAELEPDYWRKLTGTETPEAAEVLNCLELISHWDNDTVFDFSLPGSVTDYVISVRFDQYGQPTDISIES
jgi:hypothetical protein